MVKIFRKRIWRSERCYITGRKSIEGEKSRCNHGDFSWRRNTYGLKCFPSGRMGEDATFGLSKTLKQAGFRLGRLKTGTPPRLSSLEPSILRD